MIRSFFILTTKGDVIIEKHYRGYLNRTVVDTFMTHAMKHERPKDVPPVISTAKIYLVHILVGSLFFVAPVEGDVPPLLVLEFLYRVRDIFENYFGNVTEVDIKNHFVTVYQLLEEVMDSGLPFTTYPNILRGMVQPPSALNFKALKKDLTDLPEELTSNTAWRKTTKHTNNEIFFDIYENIDAVVDMNGMLLHSSVYGHVDTNCRLSGMPDLTLRWTNPRLIDDASFHPCVRYNRFEHDKVVSFVPPDGRFVLMKYRIYQPIQPPMYCKPSITFNGTSAKVNIMVGPKNLPTGKFVEDVVVTIPFSKVVNSVNLEATIGNFSWDDIRKVVRWVVGKIPKDKVPMLTGSASVTPGMEPPDANPSVMVDFRVNMFTVSGLKVDSLALHNESYKPYKGVKSITKAGHFEVRC